MSTADTTRLLVLGVVRIFEPANGYQLRRELLSWDVESWANINPGSIYSMLATLTRQGMLERHEIAASPGIRAVAVYRVTEQGKEELRNLVRAGITTVTGLERTQLYAALSLMATLFDRGEVLELFYERLRNLVAVIDDLNEKRTALEGDSGTPPHVGRMVGFSASLCLAEFEWLQEFAEAVRDGELVFAGEPAMASWKPAPNDPAWRMMRERAVYLDQLGDS